MALFAVPKSPEWATCTDCAKMALFAVPKSPEWATCTDCAKMALFAIPKSPVARIPVDAAPEPARTACANVAPVATPPLGMTARRFSGVPPALLACAIAFA